MKRKAMQWNDRKHYGFLALDFQQYEVTGHNITITSGILDQTIETYELFRVCNKRVYRGLLHRLLGLCDIYLQIDGRKETLVLKNVRYDAGVTHRRLWQEIDACNTLFHAHNAFGAEHFHDDIDTMYDDQYDNQYDTRYDTQYDRTARRFAVRLPEAEAPAPRFTRRCA